MSLSTEIMTALKTAMKEKDQTALTALRAVKSAILLAQTETGSKEELTEEQELKILQKQVKQRKDSAAMFLEQNREDLAAPELAEAAIIAQFLPEDMSEEELAQVQAQAEKAQAMEQLQMQEIQGNLEKLTLEREQLKVKIIELQKKTETEEVKDDKLIAETEKILSEVRRSNAEIAAMKSNVQANIQQQLDAIQV